MVPQGSSSQAHVAALRQLLLRWIAQTLRPIAADRTTPSLLASLDADEGEQLNQILLALLEPEAEPAAVRSVLGDAELRVAMVQLLAFQLRLPAPRGSESKKLKLQRRNGLLIARLLTTVLQSKQTGPAAEAGQADLTGLLLRTHSLEATARQLAAIAESGAWRDDRAATLDCVKKALYLAALVTGLEDDEATNAVADSLLLDHTGHLLLLVESSVPPQAEFQEASRLGLLVELYASTSNSLLWQLKDAVTQEEVAVLQRRMEAMQAGLEWCTTGLATQLPRTWEGTDGPGEAGPTSTSGLGDEGVGPSEGPPSEGPCARRLANLCEHQGLRLALVLLGAAAVRRLEGGAPQQSAASCPGNVAGDAPLGERLRALLDALSPKLPWKGRPGPLTSTRLLLRLGLALKQHRPAAAGPAMGTAGTAAVTASAAGPSGAAGSASQRRARGGAAAALPPDLDLPAAKWWNITTRALLYAAEHVAARGPLREERPGWAVAAKDAWGLAGSLLGDGGGMEAGAGSGTWPAGDAEEQGALEHLAMSMTNLVLTIESSWCEASDSQEGCWVFPEAAPPGVAAAAAGGALPLLERLLRRTGDAPTGPEAALLAHVRSNGPGHWSPAVPLLAYGPPLQAAAFLATVTKLLRGAQPRSLLYYGGMSDCQGLVVVADVVRLLAVEPAFVRVASYASTGDGAAWGANRGLQQLALVLSPTLPDWVRQLSRLLREAAALEEEAWQRELAAGREARGRRGAKVGLWAAEDESEGESEDESQAEQEGWMLLLHLLLHLNNMLQVSTPLGPDQGPQGEGPTVPGPDHAQQTRLSEHKQSAGIASAAGEPPSAAGATPSADGGGGLPSASRCGGPVLTPTEVAELFGAALTLLQRLAPSQAGTEPSVVACECVGAWCLEVAESNPAEVRAACSGGARSNALAWRPEAIRAVAGALATAEEAGEETEEAAAEEADEDEVEAEEAEEAEQVGLVAELEALAVRVEGWRAAGGQGEAGDEGEGQGESKSEGVGEGAGVGDAAEGEAGAEDVGSAAAGDGAIDVVWTGGCLGDVVARFAVAPAEARRLVRLPACANPACANLAGDSEAGLRLRQRQCGRCGRVSYCCRKCQTAHWHAGHKEACGGCK